MNRSRPAVPGRTCGLGRWPCCRAPSSCRSATRPSRLPRSSVARLRPSLLELEAAVTRSPRDPEAAGDPRPRLPGQQRLLRVRWTRSSAPCRWDRGRRRRTTGWAWRSRARQTFLEPSRNSGRPSHSIRSTGAPTRTSVPRLAQSGDYAEAVEVFQRALALEPNSVGAHLNLGMALAREGGSRRGAGTPETCRRRRAEERRYSVRARADAAAERRSRRAPSRPSRRRLSSTRSCAKATTRWARP